MLFIIFIPFVWNTFRFKAILNELYIKAYI
jgi:hypothetical protein